MTTSDVIKDTKVVLDKKVVGLLEKNLQTYATENLQSKYMFKFAKPVMPADDLT